MACSGGNQLIEGLDALAGRCLERWWVHGVNGCRSGGCGQLGSNAKGKAAVLAVGLTNRRRMGRELSRSHAYNGNAPWGGGFRSKGPAFTLWCKFVLQIQVHQR